jgi:hypothetical protein
MPTTIAPISASRRLVDSAGPERPSIALTAHASRATSDATSAHTPATTIAGYSTAHASHHSTPTRQRPRITWPVPGMNSDSAAIATRLLVVSGAVVAMVPAWYQRPWPAPSTGTSIATVE